MKLYSYFDGKTVFKNISGLYNFLVGGEGGGGCGQITVSFTCALYNTPHYSMDLDIAWLRYGSKSFYHGILQRNYWKRWKMTIMTNGHFPIIPL